ncbi:MAG: hypothetical protein ACO1NO_03795 [Burkholderiaceae bacterium]
MTINFEQSLDKNLQSDLADEIVATVAAVVSNASAPDFAVRTLEQGLLASLSPEQREAAVVMQAYASKCAGEVFTPGLDNLAAERATALTAALEEKCPGDALRAFNEQSEAGAVFKSRMSHAIASKCADLAAAEIDRLKKGKITILDEKDAETFHQRHEKSQAKQTEAAVSFLASLPERYPPFGMQLFSDIQQQVQNEIEEKYKSPDIHAKVASLFRQAREAMSSKT